MRKDIILIALALFHVSVMLAQGFETSISMALNRDATLIVFSASESAQVSGILASGSVRFTSPNGSLRILAADKYGYEALVYESFPSMAPKGGNDVFEQIGLETARLKDLDPVRIYLLVSGAEVSKLRILVLGLNSAMQQAPPGLGAKTINVRPSSLSIASESSMRANIISRLNRSLEASGALWRAGDTPFSRKSYEEKKELFGGTVPKFNGAEYYIGGIFEVDNSATVHAYNSDYVPDFDWRTRHNATTKGSPYFQDEVTGWITPVKDQAHCGSCWAFSAVGAMESVAKLYRNTTYDFDLAEQEVVSCSDGWGCHGGFASDALDYICNNMIQDELSFPYMAQDRPCSEKGKPLYAIKNAGMRLFSPSGNESASTDTLKSMILMSPLAGNVNSWSHSMTLVGYRTIKAGDVVYEHYNTKIAVQPGDSRIGKTAWIFKNSWGEQWGDHGFLYAFVNISNMANSAAPTLPFDFKYYPANNPSAASRELRSALLTPARAYDRDNDGYYWWGIGPRPDNLPANAQWEEDGDDSDASIGPMDKYGSPTLLKDYDFYIKDNAEDMGFEPNTTVKDDNFWSAPEVWVRHEKDGVMEHQNPQGGKTNYIYVRVWNRGRKTSPESLVTAYWAKAGTNLQWPEAWTGIMRVDNIPVGGLVNGFGDIPILRPGEYADVSIEWRVPNPEQFSSITNPAIGGDNLWHFCLLLMIADKNDGLTYSTCPDIQDFVTFNNNVAQRNVTIIKADSSSSYEGAVSIMNHLNQQEAYSLEVMELPNPSLAPSSPFEVPHTVFGNARVRLRMSPQLLSAWNTGGSKGSNVRGTSSPYVQEIISTTGCLSNIILGPKEIGLVKLSVNFINTLPIGTKPEKHTLLLRQKDKNGKVVGGETFEIFRDPRVELYPGIDATWQGATVKLCATGVDEDADYQWFDSRGNMVAQGQTMTCTPIRDEKYKMEVTARKDGYLASSEILVKAAEGSMIVSPTPVKSDLTVSYDLPNGEYQLLITGAQSQVRFGEYALDNTQNEITVNVSGLPKGIYIATIIGRDGQPQESVKFVKE